MMDTIKWYLGKIWNHFRHFWLPWIIFGLMLFVAFSCEGSCKRLWLYVLMSVFTIALLFKPMNIVHGMIGTQGDIRLFFIYFLIVNFIFSTIYYFAFFKNAGITYDVNQPHIEYSMFKTESDTVMMKDVCCGSKEESLPATMNDSVHYYYRTTYDWVLRNTFLTSLIQEPTDFFSACGTFTGLQQTQASPNYAIARTFHWFLLFHILVSWILLGVFISLIYQKFRNT